MVSNYSYLTNYFVSNVYCKICVLSSVAEFGHSHWEFGTCYVGGSTSQSWDNKVHAILLYNNHNTQVGHKLRQHISKDTPQVDEPESSNKITVPDNRVEVFSVPKQKKSTPIATHRFACH
jgi:hypothetical protein